MIGSNSEAIELQTLSTAEAIGLNPILNHENLSQIRH
jgi:hypothetical protein